MLKAWLAIIVAISPAVAFASDRSTRQPFESCMLTQALALERNGSEIDEVLAAAQRACRDAKEGLPSRAVADITEKVRLTVMQQRLDARNTLRRG
jgi:hypothetical protein